MEGTNVIIEETARGFNVVMESNVERRVVFESVDMSGAWEYIAALYRASRLDFTVGESRVPVETWINVLTDCWLLDPIESRTDEP